MMNEMYDYEEDLDVLYIYNNPSNKMVEGNLVLENMVLDIGREGEILGAEIDCASKFLNLPLDYLKNLKTAQIKIIKFRNMIKFEVNLVNNAGNSASFQFVNLKNAGKIPIATC